MAGVADVDQVDRVLVERFVNALVGDGPAAPATIRTRRAALRALFADLRLHGLVDFDPTMDLAVPSGEMHTVVQLSDNEISRCRWAAETALVAGPRYTAALAALEAGASTGETGCLAWDDVALDGSSIRIHGSHAQRPRTLTPTAWGQRALLDARGHATSAYIAVLRCTTYDSRRTSVTHVVREILERGGAPAGAEPRSITAWAAQRILNDAGRIEAAARAIGFESLDRTAALIGFDWHDRELP